MRMVLLGALMMVASVSWAQSPKSDGDSGITAASAIKFDQRRGHPPMNPPLPVTVIQSTVDAAHSSEREKFSDEFNKAYLNSQVRVAVAAERQADSAIASAAITFGGTAIAGFGLWFLMKTYRETKITARASIRAAYAAKRAAKAAELSARAAIGVELPNLIIVHLDFAMVGGNLSAKLQYPAIDAAMKNFGRTPAFISAHCVRVVYGDTLPEDPDYLGGIVSDAVDTVTEKDSRYEMKGIFVDCIPAESIEKLQQGEMNLWVYGFVRYRDFLGQQHEAKFCKNFVKVSVQERKPLYFFSDWRNNEKYTDSYYKNKYA